MSAYRTGKVLNAYHEDDKTIAERDLHNKFCKWGLSLPVPIEDVVHQCGKTVHTTHWVKPSTWVQNLMKLHPECLTGGFKKEKDIQFQLRSFWRYFEAVHPEHLVFKTHRHRLDRVLPLALFGDEGRGPKRGQFLIWSMESILGISDYSRGQTCTCKAKLRCMPKVDETVSGDAMEISDDEYEQFLRAKKQSTNNTHHSYLTRHVLFGLPSFIYKSHPVIEYTHIQLLVKDLENLFTSGVHAGRASADDVWFGAVLGSKGDFKHQTAIGNLDRSYHSIGVTAGNLMCSHCLAGAEGIPFERTDFSPVWESTLHSNRPWTLVPDLCAIPYDPSKPEHLLKFDLFHLYKVGLGRDLAGSAVIVWCRLGFWDDPDPTSCDSKNIDQRLERAHSSFKLFCLQAKKSPGLRSFTRTFFNASTQAHSPWSNSKGSDTMLLLHWLCWFAKLHIQMPTDASRNHQHMLKLFVHTAEASFDMFDIVYSHGLWLDRSCTKVLYLKVMQLLKGYQALATEALKLKVAAWGLKPKFHALHHVSFDLRSQLLHNCKICLNPVVWGNEQNEDTIGRVSRLSKLVSVRTITRRVLNRYFLKKRALLKRHAVLGKNDEECLAQSHPWLSVRLRSWPNTIPDHTLSKALVY